MKRCFFIGHRDSRDDVFSLLLKAVDTHAVNYGVREFIVGRYGNFDRLAAVLTDILLFGKHELFK